MTKLYVALQNLMHDVEEGQGLAEYGIILAFVAVACVVAVTALGGRINTLLGSISFGGS